MQKVIRRPIIIALLLWLGQSAAAADTVSQVPPEIVEGEAGTCSIEARIAVAKVYQRNQQMNGWSDTPSPSTIYIVDHLNSFTDYSGGGQFVFSRQDHYLEAVKQIVATHGPAKAVFSCEAGLKLYVY